MDQFINTYPQEVGDVLRWTIVLIKVYVGMVVVIGLGGLVRLFN